MKRITILLASAFCLMALTTSCNDEWTEEQYEHYVSFKSPLDDTGGVTSVYVPFTRHNDDGTEMYGRGQSSYQLPMIVSGTTTNSSNFTVKVGHDTDTLSILNYAWFQNREDLYYKDMSDYATYPSTVDFVAGEDVSLLDIRFDFNNIDMVEKWVLPIQVIDDGTSPYLSHPRKHYGKALLRVFPYNDYSGNYSATTLLVANSPTQAGLSSAEGSGQETARAYVVSEDEVFFYMGTIDESRTDRKNYKVYAKFIPKTNTDGSTSETEGTVEMYADNEKNMFESPGTATYTIYDKADDVQPYLNHHYIIISNINYTFKDYTIMGEDYYKQQLANGVAEDDIFSMWYKCSGTLTLERQINTQIPNEDQAIDW